MARCIDCRHCHNEEADPTEEPTYRCGVRVPFWVPLPVHDFGSWVFADDGEKCMTFEAKPKQE